MSVTLFQVLYKALGKKVWLSVRLFQVFYKALGKKVWLSVTLFQVLYKALGEKRWLSVTLIVLCWLKRLATGLFWQVHISDWVGRVCTLLMLDWLGWHTSDTGLVRLANFWRWVGQVSALLMLGWSGWHTSDAHTDSSAHSLPVWLMQHTTNATQCD